MTADERGAEHDDSRTGHGARGDDLDSEVIGERRHLLALAFRMLGTVAEAEDVVQETYLRWYRVDAAERSAIEVPRAWLTRVASRICLDVLGSARVRRVQYVGPWLPEPIPGSALPVSTADDPLDRVTLDDSVSTALLLVLESMTPAERVAFVLHEVFAVPFAEIAVVTGRSEAACRQLASSARRRVQGSAIRQVSRQEHDHVVAVFGAAAQAGDFAGLVAALDPSVVLDSDGGGIVSAARKPVRGSDRVARFLFGILQKQPETEVQPLETADGLGFAIWRDGRITGVVTLEVRGGLVSGIRMMMNPQKLTLWHSATR